MPDDNPQGGANKAEELQKLLAKHNGDAMAVLGILYSDNFDVREKNRRLKEQVPAEGSVVLTKADAERWEKFKAIGKKPDELEAIIKEHGDTATEVNRLKRKDTLRDVAEVGFGGSRLKLSVLEKLDGEFADDKPEYAIKDDGKGGRAVTVKRGGKELPLEQFAAESWADFVPALKAGAVKEGASRGNGGDPPPAGNLSTLERIRQQEEERQKKTAPPTGGSVRERWFSRRAS